MQVLAQLLERPAVAAVAADLAWDLSPGAGQHLVQQTLWALQVMAGHLCVHDCFLHPRRVLRLKSC